MAGLYVAAKREECGREREKKVDGVNFVVSGFQKQVGGHKKSFCKEKVPPTAALEV